MSQPPVIDISSRFERASETLVLLAALATIPLVIAQQQGAEDTWIVICDWVV